MSGNCCYQWFSCCCISPFLFFSRKINTAVEKKKDGTSAQQPKTPKNKKRKSKQKLIEEIPLAEMHSPSILNGYDEEEVSSADEEQLSNIMKSVFDDAAKEESRKKKEKLEKLIAKEKEIISWIETNKEGINTNALMENLSILQKVQERKKEILEQL